MGSWIKDGNFTHYHEYSWDSGKEALEDIDIGYKGLVLVDSDFILYPTAFSSICKQGYEAAQEAAISKLEHYLSSVELEDCRVIQFFTGKGSPKYRDQFYKNVPYKANRTRPGAPIPQYVDEIKMALASKSTTVFCDPAVGEADDYISIFARASWIHRFAAAHVIGSDKDLLQIPSVNHRKGMGELRNTHESNLFLYRQILMGDQADNIPGLKGCGPKRAQTIIPDSVTEEEEMFSRVCKEYFRCHGGTEDEVTDYLFETANLLYLRRDFNDYWNPPV